MSNYIAVDLGGTNTRVALFKTLERADIVAQEKRINTHNYENDLRYIAATAKKLSNNIQIDGIGIGVPGRVSDDKTEMVASNNLSEWTNRGFCKDLARELDCSVHMDNDGVAAGLGEGYYGKMHTDFHYLIWGTGISSVSVRHNEGDVLAKYIRPEYKSFFDNWESECGGAGIIKKFSKTGEQLSQKEWADLNMLFAHRLKEYVTLAKPPAIVFGGGLAVHHAETITGHSAEMGLPIQITKFAENSGLVGALSLVKRGTVSNSSN